MRAYPLRGFLVTVFLFSGLALAHAEKRVALVIGNSNYREVPKLSNPMNDADAVSLLLKNAGFEVVQTRTDLGVNEMRRAVRDFSDTTRYADMAVLFYAGHGIEVNGTNYLIPVDASLARDIDVEDETVSLDRVLQIMDSAKRLRLVILDACRDNPFVKAMKRTIASRSIGRGLARVEPSTSDTLIAFAAKAGSTANDGDGTHSPFTTALLRHIATPGLDVRIAFGRVRDDVLKDTDNKQEPFVYGSLGGANITLVSLSSEQRTDTGPQVPRREDDIAARDYSLASQVATKEAWEAFLAKHPKGFYADLARAQRAKVIGPSTKPDATDVHSVASDKKAKKAKSGASTPSISRDQKGRIKTPSETKTSNAAWMAKTCAQLRSNVRNWRAAGVPDSHPGMVSTMQSIRQNCGGG